MMVADDNLTFGIDIQADVTGIVYAGAAARMNITAAADAFKCE